MEGWHVLLSGVVGSTAYGLAGPDSDVDRLSVAAAPTAEFLGLGRPAESVVTTDPDHTTHEVGKYAILALRANPTVTELLWLGRYEFNNRFGRELIAMRRAFLSAPLIRNAYLGYAQQQFTKLQSRGDGSFSADTRKRTSKHARHLARLCDQGFQLYASADLQVALDNPQYYHDFGERVAAGNLDTAKSLIADTESKFNETVSPLPAEPDKKAVEDWLKRVRRFYYT